MLKRITVFTILTLAISVILPSCKINYSFTGANLPVSVKTFSVYYFPNRARLVNATLSQTFTEELRDKLSRQTSLKELSENGDIEFRGEITGYNLQPMAIEKDDQASQTRLTITINLKYTSNKEPDDSFEKTFSAYADYDSSLDFSSQEDDLNEQIIEDLTEDIFNATIANW